MARVNIEQCAFTDSRFARLASIMGYADADHARGKMLLIWNENTERSSHCLPDWVINFHLGPSGAAALIECELADAELDGFLRIRGTGKRTDWLGKNRQASSRGGKERARQASRVGGRFTSRVAGETTSAPAPAPAPAPAKEEERESGKPDVPLVSPPHVELAEVAVAEINRLRRSRYRAESEAILKDCRALVKAKRTPEQVKAVIASKSKWIGDMNMEEQFKPSVLLRPSNFAKYLDDVNAEPLFTRGDERRIASPDDDEPDLTYAGFGIEASA